MRAKESPLNPQIFGALLMIGSAAAWAIGLVASKGVLERTVANPVAVLNVQLGASVALLVAIKLIRKQSFNGSLRQGWPGLLEPGLAYQLSLMGLATTSASHATVIASLEPAVIPVILWLGLRRRPTPLQACMTLLATAGAILVASQGTAGSSNLNGDLLVFGGVVAAAAYVVVSHRDVADHDPFTLAAAQQIWALVMTFALTILITSTGDSFQWPTLGWDFIAIGASGWCNYALPFALYLTALRYLPLALAAPFLALIPVFGLTAAWSLLGEKISVTQGLGAAVVVLALVTVTLWGPAEACGELASLRNNGRDR
jgi:drug/metabolite transporter (DMT)-like permease